MDAPRISRPVLRFFRFIVRGYFRRHFHAVRVSHPERLAEAGRLPGPLLVYANHSSWWDPMVQVFLGEKLLPGRRHFAPMDASALARYRIFRQLGVFGVEMHSLRGAAQFLRTGLRVLAEGGVLWVTPQGRFADARERPLEFRPGLAALAARVPGGCSIVPLAIEYPFWNERLPECLLRFGEVISVEGQSAEEVESALESALLRTMEQLKVLAVARDPGGFTEMQRGRLGTGGFYALGQRAWAGLRGRRFQPEHTPLVPRERT